MLRTRSAHTGVAEESQHSARQRDGFTHISDVKLNEAARDRHEAAGRRRRLLSDVWFASSSTGMDGQAVRAWPRMDSQDLVRLFPDGKTMHIPWLTGRAPLAGLTGGGCRP